MNCIDTLSFASVFGDSMSIDATPRVPEPLLSFETVGSLLCLESLSLMTIVGLACQRLSKTHYATCGTTSFAVLLTQMATGVFVILLTVRTLDAVEYASCIAANASVTLSDLESVLVPHRALWIVSLALLLLAAVCIQMVYVVTATVLLAALSACAGALDYLLMYAAQQLEHANRTAAAKALCARHVYLVQNTVACMAILVLMRLRRPAMRVRPHVRAHEVRPMFEV